MISGTTTDDAEKLLLEYDEEMKSILLIANRILCLTHQSTETTYLVSIE